MDPQNGRKNIKLIYRCTYKQKWCTDKQKWCTDVWVNRNDIYRYIKRNIKMWKNSLL